MPEPKAADLDQSTIQELIAHTFQQGALAAVAVLIKLLDDEPNDENEAAASTAGFPNLISRQRLKDLITKAPEEPTEAPE
jgi:hypothetical protein